MYEINLTGLSRDEYWLIKYSYISNILWFIFICD